MQRFVFINVNFIGIYQFTTTVTVGEIAVEHLSILILHVHIYWRLGLMLTLTNEIYFIRTNFLGQLVVGEVRDEPFISI